MTTKKKKKKTTPPPTKYNVIEIDGKVVIPRDFFWTTCPSQLDDTWASLTVPFRPFFDPAAMHSGIVDKNHECGRVNDSNIKLWKSTVINDILGKKFRDYMKEGWNNALADLTRGSTKPSAMTSKDNTEVDFTFNGNSPVTQDDARSILFGTEVTDMVKKGRLEQPLALLFMWGYYLTMEGCTIPWATKATDRYIKDMNYKVVLGESCAGTRAMSFHGWRRVGTKVAVNSFQTQLRKQQKKIWGIMFEGALKVDEKANQDINNELEIVDIGAYLPHQVKADMSRLAETRFMVRRFSNKVIDAETRLKMKVEDLFDWADKHGIDRAKVTTTIREGEDGGTFAKAVTTATEDNGDCASDDADEGIDQEHIADAVVTATVVNGDCRIDDVGEVVIVNAQVPTMAPTRTLTSKDKREQNGPQKKSVGGKNSTKKTSGNATNRKKTVNALALYLTKKQKVRHIPLSN